jgi:hypothetical protein
VRALTRAKRGDAHAVPCGDTWCAHEVAPERPCPRRERSGLVGSGHTAMTDIV